MNDISVLGTLFVIKETSHSQNICFSLNRCKFIIFAPPELPTYQWMTFLFEGRILYHFNSRYRIRVFSEIKGTIKLCSSRLLSPETGQFNWKMWSTYMTYDMLHDILRRCYRFYLKKCYSTIVFTPEIQNSHILRSEKIGKYKNGELITL